MYVFIEILFLNQSIFFKYIRFRRQLVKLIDFCLQMTDLNISNDEKQSIESKLSSLIHVIALRKSNSFVFLNNSFFH